MKVGGKREIGTGIARGNELAKDANSGGEKRRGRGEGFDKFREEGASGIRGKVEHGKRGDNGAAADMNGSAWGG